MAETGNYQLNQWEKTDRIQMEDFNADNAKVDAALAEHGTALALCGNCKIVHGSYTGTGTNGSANPNKLTFSNKPIFVMIQGSATESEVDKKLRMMQGITWAVGVSGNYVWKNFVTWTGNSVEWYANQSANTQFNTSGATYHYMALLAAGE